MTQLTRRTFLSVAAIGPLAAWQSRGDGHLTARPKPPTIAIKPGEHPLGLGSERDGLLIVPPSYRAQQPAPLVVLLHGAGGSARRVSSLFAVATDLGAVILAPESRDRTWDAIRGRFGPDVDFLNRLVNHCFDRCAIDRTRLAIGGFSDGATYALSIGTASGDLFTHILACSPGFIVRSTPRGRPRIYMSHGTADQVLPIDATSRRLLPELKAEGYSVTYREFDGPHTVPPAISREALEWLTKRS